MRTNIAAKKAATLALTKTTHEGALASKITPEQQLRRVILACLLWEDQFYIDGKKSAEQITEAVAKVLAKKNGPKIVSDLAIETRTEGKLRHAPLYLTLALVRAGNKKSELGKSCRSLVAETLEGVIQRPDELAEFVAMYWEGGGGSEKKRAPLTAQVKKGLGRAFRKFNEYSLSKYANKEGNVSMRDVLFLTHPKPIPGEQADLWKKLANKELTAPDTWESNLSAGKDKKETFTRLLKEKKLGALALLRNLRNMTESGVDQKLIKSSLVDMQTERVLPFRFVSAAKYAPKFEPQLETAMFKCLAGMPKLSGKTVLLVDNSGSMYNTKVSSKSEMDRSDAACALAMLLREICEDSEVIVFSDSAKSVPARRGFALRELIQKAVPVSGTNTERGKQAADAAKYDRLIIFTDEQSHTNLSAPKGLGYVVNVAAYQNGIGYGPWVHVDGFSESIVDFIVEYERINDQSEA